ncbi:hypothetical protein F5Y10DRAFT_284118 [Nemania abortiva]|nr:hypothetical protein F5Y10DRAFT_284118 [Nemania abortiva]
MAIIEGLSGIEVTIITNGCTAKEYDDPYGGLDKGYKCAQVVTKYIECKDDEPFRIHLKVTDEYAWGFKDHLLNLAAVIDGIWVKGELCRQKDTEEEDWEQDISYRVVKNPDNPARYVLQEFAFARIIKVDDATDEQHASDVDRMERLGTIEVQVHRATSREPGPALIPRGEHPREFAVSRDAAKWRAPSHGIKFTGTQPARKPQYTRCSKLRDDDGPIGIFRFKYRSRDALRREGITPDPQDPSAWLVDISDDGMSDHKQRNSKSNRRNVLSNNRGVEQDIKREDMDDSQDIALSLPQPNSGQSSNAGTTQARQIKQPTHSDPKNMKREASANYPALPVAASPHSVTQTSLMSEYLPLLSTPITAIDFAYFPPLISNISPYEGKRFPKSLFKPDDDDDKEKHEISLATRVDDDELSGLDPHRNIIPSIENDDEITAIRTRTRARLDHILTIAQDLGQAIIPDNKKKDSARLNEDEGLVKQLQAVDSAIQSAKAPSTPKRAPQAITKPNTVPLIDIEYHHQGLQRFQELRQEYFRISDGIYKEIELSYCQSSFAPITTPTPTPTPKPSPILILSPSPAPRLTRYILFPPSISPSPPQFASNHISTPDSAMPTVAPLNQTSAQTTQERGDIEADSPKSVSDTTTVYPESSATEVSSIDIENGATNKSVTRKRTQPIDSIDRTRPSKIRRERNATSVRISSDAE